MKYNRNLEIVKLAEKGETYSAIAKKYNTTRQNISRIVKLVNGYKNHLESEEEHE